MKSIMKNIKDFRDKNLVFVDVETTGLSPDTHEVIEIGAIVCEGRNFSEIREYSAKIKPEHIERAEKEALKINGYSFEKWKEAAPAKETFIEFANISPNAVIAGWNVTFDWEFLEHTFSRHKIIHKFNYHKIDVPSIAYTKLVKMENFESLSLRNVAPLFGIKLPTIHSALEDIRATYEIFKRVLEKDTKQETLGL